jgi:peptide/nickel transport system permease protein
MAVDDFSVVGLGQADDFTRSTSGVRSLMLGALRTRRGRIGGGLVAIVVLIAVIGPLLAPKAPDAFVSTPFASPSGGFPLGTDVIGRDVLSRLLDGGWLILLVAAGATALGVSLGTAIGVLAAFEGGKTESLLMRGNDVLLAFPQLVLALLVVSVIGAQVWLIVVVVGIAHAPQVARVIRAVTLDVSERDFVKAEELMGISRRRIMVSEVLPHLTSVVMVEVGLRLTYSVVVISGLSFLGFGLPPPTPNWGTMVNENRIGLTQNAWATLAPVFLIVLLTVGTNTFTDAVARVSLGLERPERRRRAESRSIASDALR